MRDARKLGMRAFAPFIAALGLAALACDAHAQTTSAQQSAIRSSCRSDFMAKCSGVSPGGKDALTCLQKNVDSLSPACKSAIAVTLPPPAPAEVKPAEAKPAEPKPAAAAPAPAAPAATAAPAAPAAPVVAAPPPKAKVTPPPRAAAKPAAAAAAAPAQAAPTTTAAQQSAIKASCRSDFMSKCSGVTPGGKDALACLQKNVGTLSGSCKQAVSVTMAPAPAASAAPAQAAPTPTAAQQNAIKSACRSDFMSKCSGITPGGPDALACLQRNVSTLSGSCQQTVSVTMTPGATPVAVTPAEPAPRMPKAPLATAIVTLRACKLDLIRYCNDVQPGGGRELACLAAHEKDLTIRCRTARKVSAPLR